MATRTPAVANAPNSSVLMRMNKNEAPQIEASSMKSSAQAGWGLRAETVDAGWFAGVVLAVKASFDFGGQKRVGKRQVRGAANRKERKARRGLKSEKNQAWRLKVKMNGEVKMNGKVKKRAHPGAASPVKTRCQAPGLRGLPDVLRDVSNAPSSSSKAVLRGRPPA